LRHVSIPSTSHLFTKLIASEKSLAAPELFHICLWRIDSRFASVVYSLTFWKVRGELLLQLQQTEISKTITSEETQIWKTKNLECNWTKEKIIFTYISYFWRASFRFATYNSLSLGILFKGLNTTSIKITVTKILHPV
jgi:hypothetical protein